MSVPSLSTLEGVKKYINAMGNSPSAVAPKQTVMLDWASKEDGTHVLTITVGNKVMKIYLSVSQKVTELVRTPGTFLFSGSFFDFGVI